MTDEDKDGCRYLEVYRIAHALALRIHAMTLRLPSFEMYEEGSQVRRSSKSVSSLLVEGHRWRKYRDQYLNYLHRAVGSADETREHLDLLFMSGSLKDASEFGYLSREAAKLLAKLIQFMIGAELKHSKPFYLRPEAAPNHPSPIGKSPIANR